MASDASPPCIDDFVMLEARQILDLPVRRKRSAHEAEHEAEILSSDDDLEHISGPASVRSLDSPSPEPSQIPSPITRNLQTASIPAPLRVIRSGSRSSQAGKRRKHSGHADIELQYAEPAIQTPPTVTTTPSCDSHHIIDQQIVDLLIEHALTTRIEREYGQGCSKDQKLRQQMLTRFRSLPADHSVVKDSINRIEGRKVLFQGQPRSMRDIEDIYLAVFTDVESMALNFLTECHIRHFQGPCSFYGSFMPSSRDRLFAEMSKLESYAGKALAVKIQGTVMDRLGVDRAFSGPSDGLRRQTWRQVDNLVQSESNMAPDSRRWHRTIRNILQTTILNLPNKHYVPGDPMNFCITTPSMTGLEEDSSEQKEKHARGSSGPHSGQLQPDAPRLRGGSGSSFELINHTVDVESAQDGNREGANEDTNRLILTPSSSSISLWNGSSLATGLTKGSYDAAADRCFQELNLKLERLYYLDNEKRQPLSASDRLHGTLPHVLQLFMLGELCRKRTELTHQKAAAVVDSQPASCTHTVQAESMKPDPYFQPVGHLRDTMQEMGFTENYINLSQYERAWIQEHATYCALITSSRLKLGFWNRMMVDPEVFRHVEEHDLSVSVYAFQMDALLLLKAVTFADAHGLLKQKTSITPNLSTNRTLQDWQMELMLREQKRMKQALSKKHEAIQLQAAVQEADTTRPSASSRQLEDDLSRYEMQVKLLAQQEAKRNLVETPKARQLEASMKAVEAAQRSAENSRENAAQRDYRLQLFLLEQQKEAKRVRESTQEKCNEQYSLPVFQDSDRAWRRDTLLARSTQHPLLPESNVKAKSISMSDKMNVLQSDSEIKRDRPTNLVPDFPFPPFPPIQVSNAQILSEMTIGQRGQLPGYKIFQSKADDQAKWSLGIANVSPTQRPRFVPDPYQKDPLSAVVQADYQHQLMLLERQNRRRLMYKRQAEEAKRRDHETYTSPSSDQIPPPVCWLDDKVDYITFWYDQGRGLTQYTIRIDIDTVDMDSLSQTFKDDNCLHASCEGWKSTAERIREAQTEHWRSVKSRMDIVDQIPKQEAESAHIKRQKRKENEIAWALAKLNPILRHATGASLRTAVEHYLGWKSGAGWPKEESQTQRSTKTLTPAAKRPEPVPVVDPFIIQNSDDIMNDEDLETSSSSSEEEDEECPCKSSIPGHDDECHDSTPFPMTVTALGQRYMIFQSGCATGSASTFYAVRASGLGETGPVHKYSTSFTQDNCICHKICKVKTNDSTAHHDDCNLAIDLARLNSMLAGKDKEELRYAAMMNHCLLKAVHWRSRRHIQLGEGDLTTVLNRELPESEVSLAFVVYRPAPPPAPMKAECIYCRMALNRCHYVDRVVHMACCHGYYRHTDGKPAGV